MEEKHAFKLDTGKPGTDSSEHMLTFYEQGEVSKIIWFDKVKQEDKNQFGLYLTGRYVSFINTVFSEELNKRLEELTD